MMVMGKAVRVPGHGGTGATDDLTRNKYGLTDPPIGHLASEA